MQNNKKILIVLGLLILIAVLIHFDIYLFEKREVKVDVVTYNAVIDSSDSQKNMTVMNLDRDFWAYNMGTNGVTFNFVEVPPKTVRLKIERSTSINGPWTIAADVKYDDFVRQAGLVDSIDGTKSDLSYKMDALDKNNVVLRHYGVINLPKYIEE